MADLNKKDAWLRGADESLNRAVECQKKTAKAGTAIRASKRKTKLRAKHRRQRAWATA
jgi:hypothetical protein